jgi:enoyl-CoA hydratase
VGTHLRSTSQGRLHILKLESEDGLPRIERRVLAELGSEIENLATTRHVTGCVIAGTERAFAVGADISELARLTPAEAHEFSREGQRVLRAIERSRVPIVAAVQGYCMGGGLDLALACHARIATPDAVFAHPGGALGILTGWGGTQRLTRLIGRALALEMFTTGRKLHAQEALAAGLVETIVSRDALMPTAEAVITRRATHRASR